VSDAYLEMPTLLGNGYLILAVPRCATKDFLEAAKRVAFFQLDLLIAQAGEESYADAEYKSWECSADSAPERKS
jgi:hypothetical protein